MTKTEVIDQLQEIVWKLENVGNSESIPALKAAIEIIDDPLKQFFVDDVAYRIEDGQTEDPDALGISGDALNEVIRDIAKGLWERSNEFLDNDAIVEFINQQMLAQDNRKED